MITARCPILKQRPKKQVIALSFPQVNEKKTPENWAQKYCGAEYCLRLKEKKLLKILATKKRKRSVKH